jgi:hypothetical protein
MQQRQLRLGDILDDYCPRERRLTNHAVVAMVGADVKQTRCTTCDAEHEYKHAKVPRQRRKSEAPAALYAQVLAGGPKRVAPEPAADTDAQAGAISPVDTEDDVDAVVAAAAGVPEPSDVPSESDINAVAWSARSRRAGLHRRHDGAANGTVAVAASPRAGAAMTAAALDDDDQADMLDSLDDEEEGPAGAPEKEEGPVHRALIRATLPRQDGQVPPPRPAPEFTIRQPAAGRPNRFRPRQPRQGQSFLSDRSNSHAPGGMRGGAARPPGNRSHVAPRAKRHGPGRKRSK